MFELEQLLQLEMDSSQSGNEIPSDLLAEGNEASPTTSPKTKRRRKESGIKEEEKGEVEQEETEETKWWKKTVRKLEKQYNSLTADNVVELFDILNDCLLKEGADFYRKEYVFQLVLSSLESLCKNEEESKKINKADFRVHLVINCVRCSKSRQSHQGVLRLLTVAAKLFQEEVLAHVMSLFTFMGSGLMKKDDNYSFELVQRTLDTVVPVLIGDLKSVDELTEMKKVMEIFRIFVGAMPDVPEHRRMILLTKLVEATVIPEDRKEEGKKICFKRLWILIGLLYDHLVTNWRKKHAAGLPDLGLDESSLKYLAQKDDDFILDFCWRFPGVDQMNCALMLLKYLEILSVGSGETCFPTIFEKNVRSGKQLLMHYRYMMLGFLGRLLAGKSLISKVARLGNEVEMTEIIGPVSEELLNASLKVLDHAAEECVRAQSDTSDKKYWKAIVLRSDLILKKINCLLPAGVCLRVIEGLLSRESKVVKKNALELLNSKLQQHPTPFTRHHVGKLSEITIRLCDWLKVQKDIPNQGDICLPQLAAYSLKLLSRVVGRFDKAPFEVAFDRCVTMLHCWKNTNHLLTGNVALCVAELVSSLGTKCLPKVPILIQDLVEILLADFCQSSDMLLLSVLTCLEKVVQQLSQFLSPYLEEVMKGVAERSSLVELYKQRGSHYGTHIAHRFAHIKKELAALEGRVLLPAVRKVYEELCSDKPEALSFVFEVLKDHIASMKGSEVLEEAQDLFSVVFVILELRCVHSERSVEELNSLENGSIEAVTSLSLKLSENSFRPFIFKLTEWAEKSRRLKESGLTLADRERLITFYKLASRLAENLKSLFILFAGQIVKMSAGLLDECNRWKTGESEGIFPSTEKKKSDGNGMKTDALLREVLNTLSRCCQYDVERELFTKDKYESLSQPLIDQLENTGVPNYRERVWNCLIPTLVNFSCFGADDSGLKKLNYILLAKTRAPKAKVRKAALAAAEAIYTRLGEDVLPLLPETVPFLAEALEDDNEEVENQCQKVIQALEGLLGQSLQEFF